MKKVTLSVCSGEHDRLARFFNCGKAGEKVYDRAVKVKEKGNGNAARKFIEENFDEPSVEMFVHQLNDDSIYVGVVDEEGDSVFEDEQFSDGISFFDFVTSDPRKWQFDKSMGKELTKRIKTLVKSENDEIEAAVSEWKKEHGDEPFDVDFAAERFTDLADGVRDLIVQAPFVDAGFDMKRGRSGKKSPPYLFAAICADLYGFCMKCDIELEDGEEFDLGKLRLLGHDYDGYYYLCNDAVLPVAMYGNKFYRLSHGDDWETHYEYYGFAKKDEGRACLEFFGKDF